MCAGCTAPPRNQTCPLSSTQELAWFINLHQTTRRHIPGESILHSFRSYVHCLPQSSVPWLRWLVVSLSSRWSWNDLGAINVEFLVDKVVLGQFPPYRVLRVFPSQYYSTNAPHSFIRLTPTAYKFVT